MVNLVRFLLIFYQKAPKSDTSWYTASTQSGFYGLLKVVLESFRMVLANISSNFSATFFEIISL